MLARQTEILVMWGGRFDDENNSNNEWQNVGP